MKRYPVILASFLIAGVASLTLYSTLEAKSASNEATRIAAFKKFTKVVNAVENYYVDPVKIDEIIRKALDGMLTNLDSHSAYLDAKQNKEMEIKTKGEFGGLGITVGMRDGALTVIAPMEGTPADKAGIESGDIILKIDDKSTIGMSIDEAVELMRGKPKTSVRLTIVRKGKEKPFETPIVRDIIKVQSVYAKIYKDDILYLRIATFDKNVVDSLRREINLQKGKARGIALDLRNNPGGLLSEAVGTVDLFVDKGVIVSQKGRVEDENEVFNATKSGTILDIPLVVLVNGGSASASEIVSGALQDHHRAVIVGEKTFGKGSVQIVMRLEGEEGDAIKLTVARYYLPSGRSIQATGVTPDVEIKRVAVKEVNDDFEIKESQLKDHLQAKLGELENKPPKEEKVAANTITEEQLSNDYQLKSAFGILRGLIALKN
ncbi:MAG: S41 family peptidase [Helicobacteraceae bacterium]|jgi:carboxyl-terminal processing protease|nr:S41 family peptidase [Helicobacteraceae bacterium]